jgi:hypothetical protein
LSSLPQLSDREFALAADVIAALVDKSVSEASSVPQSNDARAGAEWVRRRALEMAAAVEAGDAEAASASRSEIQNVLLTAADSARKALDAFYAEPKPRPSISSNIDLISLAQRAANAIASDPNYCASVAVVGSPVNAAVHAFKSAWNSTNPTDLIPINTGNFEQATAAALATVTGSSLAACPPRTSTPPIIQPPTTPSPEKGLSKGALFGIGLIGVGAAGTVIYFATKKPPRTSSRRSYL